MQAEDGGIIPGEITFVVRWSIVVSLAILLLSMATGHTGITNYMELESNRDALQRATQELDAQNQLLEQRIVNLKSSESLRIRYLKEEFGYVEPGDLIYHFSPVVNSVRGAQREDTSVKRSVAQR